MTLPSSTGADALERARRENETLYAVIKTVSSSLDLDRVLLDLERVTPCLPGAALTEESGDEYKGEMKVRLGPVSQEYEGTVKIEEADEAGADGFEQRESHHR